MPEQTPVRYRPARNQAESLQFMTTPDDWPQWPFLPVKRYSTNNQMYTGYLIHVAEGHEDRFTVFEGNIFIARPATDPKIKYDNYGAIVRDGWEVD